MERLLCGESETDTHEHSRRGALGCEPSLCQPVLREGRLTGKLIVHTFDPRVLVAGAGRSL